MDFSHQVPPTSQTPEPALSVPPPLKAVNSAAPIMSTEAALAGPVVVAEKRRRWIGWVIAGVVAVGVLGGGYFAYSHGYISVPFLTPKTDSLFSKMVDSISTIDSAQYSVRAKFESQPRESGRKPLFDSSTTNANLPDSGGILSALDPKEALRSIPGDVKVSGGLTIYVETNKLAQDANGMIKIDGLYSSSDTSIALDLELRKVNRNLYGIVRKFPSLFFFDLSGIKNKWVEITPEDNFSEVSTSTLENQDLRKSVDALKSATKRALDKKLFTVKQKLPAETIAGVRSEHYLLSMAPEKLVDVLQAIRDERAKDKGDVAELESAIKELQKTENAKLLKSIADNSRVEIWVDRAKGLLRQVRWGLTVVPDDSIERLKGKQLFLELTLTLDKVNTKVNVDKPSPTIDFDEATRLVTGITKDEQLFDKQTSRISTLRGALTTYKNANNLKYPATLEELSTSLKASYTSCIAKVNATKTSKSNDSGAISRDAKRKSDLAQIRTGLVLYYDDHNSTYPTELSVLAPAYMAAVPVDPSTNKSYTYTACGNAHFVMSATLETYTGVYTLSDAVSGAQQDIALSCPASGAATNTVPPPPSTGPTSFSIESVGSSVGLGGYSPSDYSCYDEQEYRDGVNFTDVYTKKPYTYKKNGEDYTLTYTIKLTKDVTDYDKDTYVDGLNTATSADVSIEKVTTYEKQQQEQATKKTTNTNLNTNTSTLSPYGNYWSETYACLNAAPTKTADADKDGLSDYDEVYKYITQPCLSDTDNDGYSDKTEVDGGYNPNGTGKATAEQLRLWGVQATSSTTTNTNTTQKSTAKAPQFISQALHLNPGQASVYWVTDGPADGVVNYGTTISYGSLISDKPFINNHTVNFSVTPGMSYHYAIRACSESLPSTTGCTTSQDYTFVAQ